MYQNRLWLIIKLFTAAAAILLFWHHIEQFHIDRQGNTYAKLVAETIVKEPVTEFTSNAAQVLVKETPLERSERRKRELLDYCSTRPKLRRISTAVPDHTHVIESQRLLYCRIPKVATTGWKRMIGLFLGHSEELMTTYSKEEVHARLVIPSLTNDYPNMSSWKEFFSTYYSFVFVRDPFERLLSAYRNKFALPYDTTLIDQLGPRILQLFRQPNVSVQDAYKAGNVITFVEFLRFVVFQHHNEPLYVDEHWTTYHHDCSPCAVPYSFIGKYETYREDSQAILTVLGSKFQLLSEIKDYSVDTSQIMQKYYSDVPRDLLLQVYEIFKNDFAAYGYRVPAFLKLTAEERNYVVDSKFDENVPVLEDFQLI